MGSRGRNALGEGLVGPRLMFGETGAGSGKASPPHLPYPANSNHLPLPAQPGPKDEGKREGSVRE